MSAQEQMRNMLDQLMGTARDGNPAGSRVKFDDSRVCKSFLVNCCPHDILSGTRMDLGECPRVHDLALRADFEQASKKKDYFYDVDATDHLESFLADCDRKVAMAKRKLKETQAELSEEVNTQADAIHKMGEQIGTKLAKAEELGQQGNVEESLKLLEEVEELKKAKLAAETDYRNSIPSSIYQQQKLRVCEVCCAYLGIHDNDQRLADHFGGKLHMGFITLRQMLEDLRKTIKERRSQRDNDKLRKSNSDSGRDGRRRSNSRDRVRRSRSRSRGYSRHRSRSRDRHRGSESRRRSRSRSSSRRKSSRRSRSRSRTRHEHSSSRR